VRAKDGLGYTRLIAPNLRGFITRRKQAYFASTCGKQIFALGIRGFAIAESLDYKGFRGKNKCIKTKLSNTASKQL